MTFRMLALDADGTVLDSRGELRPVVRRAVRDARKAGLEVVICTGRRFRTALPVLRDLELEAGEAVVQNGVVVKEIASGRTLWHHYLTRELYAELLLLMRQVGPPLVYVDHHAEGFDFVTETPERAHAFQSDYLAANLATARVLASIDEPFSSALVMLSCMADAERLLPLREAIVEALGARVRTNFLVNKSYRGHILEAVSAASGKWAALRRLAEARGIAPGEIAAIGDDENDAEMLAEAGLGIAMGNAVESARSAADVVTGSNDADGVAEAIERWVLG